MHLRISRAPQKLSLPRVAEKFVFFHHNSTPRENNVGHSRNLYAFKHRVIHAHVVSLGANGVFPLGIEDHEVGIAADCNGSLSWIQTKKFCGSGGNQLDESIDAETPLGNTAGVDQTHAMFDARAAIRNLREVISSQLFLLFEAERTMISRNDLKVIALESVPKFFLMPLLANAAE